MGFFSYVGGLIFSRKTVVLIGLAALAIMIWFAGPRIEMAGAKPLATTAARIAAIGALILLFVALELFRYWRLRRLNRKMIENLTSSQSLTAMTDGTADDELEVLRQRFEAAMAAMKETSVSGQHLYDLPWYLIIGPPGSGKTTILRSSGLDFPLAERLGVDVIEGVGGTRSCDWWLTDKAVLLDTAGRYTTQDINAASDASTWRGFLNILKESRPRQPINGVVIAISLADILAQDEQERRRTIEAVKARLQEIMRGFGIRMPVYLLFTKTDLVAGFSEFFEDLDEEGREQVWGITLPLDASSTGATALSAIRSRLTGLLERLNSHVPRRLNEERTAERRRQIFAFPEQMAGIRPLLENFLDEVFRPNRYSMQPLFRGVYFTSGTQEGVPIDRMKAAYANSFGFDATQPPAHSGPAKPFFINRLLTDVIIQERGLVGRNRVIERRIVISYAAACAACLLTVAGLGAFWHHGELDARAEVALLNADLDRMNEAIAVYNTTPNLANALVPLNILRKHVDILHSSELERALEWIDLDADAFLRDPVANAYARLLRQRMLPRLMELLTEDLKAAIDRKDVDAVYELLGLYLGLGDPERLDRAGLARWMTLTTEQNFPLRPDLREAVDRHFQTLLTVWNNRQPLDANLISAARRSMVTVPPVDYVYSHLEAAAGRFPSKDLSDVIGLAGRQILVRRSPSRSAPQIPYLYTADGFYDIFLRQLPTLGREQAGDDWIMGPEAKAASEEELTALLRKATDRYIENYIATWRAFVDDIGIRELRDIGDANTVLATLSGTQSPINQLLNFVADNTELPFGVTAPAATGQPAPGGGVAASAASAASAATSALGTAADRAAGATGQASPLARWPGTPITRAFADVQALMRGRDNQPPGISAIQQEIAAAYGQINAIDSASDIGKASFDAIRQRLQAQNQRDALSQLGTTAVSQPAPLRSILGALPSNLWAVMLLEARGYLNNQWRREVVGECTRAILNRYPVHRDGRDETTIKDFGTFFGPGGTLEQFQTTYLADFIDTTNRPWQNRLVDGQGLNISAALLNSLEGASVIRSTFFRSGTPSPSVDFTLRPTYLDPQAARIAIDTGSQLISYRHEPPRTFKLTWPDPSANQQVVVTMTDTNGTTSSVQTSGPWSWFRLFDQLQLQKTGLADKFVLPIDIRGKKATFELGADSINNPFELPELSAFRCQPGL